MGGIDTRHLLDLFVEVDAGQVQVSVHAFLQNHVRPARLAVLRAPAGFASFRMVPAVCRAKFFGMVNS